MTKVKETIKGSAEVSGGVLSAILSSACCWGPLLMALFGVGTSGFILWFVKFRQFFIILAAALLGRSLYLAYRTQNKRNIIVIWIMIVIAVGFMLFPYFLGIIL